MSVLQRILEHKRHEVDARKERVTADELRERVRAADAPRGLRTSLQRPGVRIIAEVKRISPAKGALRLDANAAELALQYEQGGAAGISVLTDERFFGGRDDDLHAVRAVVRLPVLRKDFTIDPYQIWEARSLGADAVLLIVRALEDSLLRELRLLAEELGMDALVEVHDEHELDRAVASGAVLLGINNRNLSTLRVDLQNTVDLLPRVPPGPTLVSESGISGSGDVSRLVECGVRAMLIGEALVTADDPALLLRQLTSIGARV